MKKIKQYLPTTPGRALYCKAKKIGNVYNVDYYYGLDESFKVFNVPPLASVLTLKDLAFITQDKNLQEEAEEKERKNKKLSDRLAEWIGKSLSGYIQDCLDGAADGEEDISGHSFHRKECSPKTYIVRSLQQEEFFPMSIYSNVEENYKVGDIVEVLDPHKEKLIREIRIKAYIGEGLVSDNENLIRKWYAKNEDFIQKLPILNEVLAAEKMQKIKNDPNLGKQAKRVLRKPPGGKKGSGDLEQDDVRGPGRFPHSETEQAFWNFHKEWSKDPRRDEGPQDGLQSMQYITGKEVEKLLFKKKVNESLILSDLNEFLDFDDIYQDWKWNQKLKPIQKNVKLSVYLNNNRLEDIDSFHFENHSTTKIQPGKKYIICYPPLYHGRSLQVMKKIPYNNDFMTSESYYKAKYLTNQYTWHYNIKDNENIKSEDINDHYGDIFILNKRGVEFSINEYEYSFIEMNSQNSSTFIINDQFKRLQSGRKDLGVAGSIIHKLKIYDNQLSILTDNFEFDWSGIIYKNN